MVWDEAKRVYTYPCPCGDHFEISRAQLANYEDIAICPGCSLVIRIVYDPVRLLMLVWYARSDSANQLNSSSLRTTRRRRMSKLPWTKNIGLDHILKKRIASAREGCTAGMFSLSIRRKSRRPDFVAIMNCRCFPTLFPFIPLLLLSSDCTTVHIPIVRLLHLAVSRTPDLSINHGCKVTKFFFVHELNSRGAT
jgi:diphthamide biosynthesis protein 3